MQPYKYRILCTRPLTDSTIAAAGENGILIDVQEFIRIKPLLLPALANVSGLQQVFGDNRPCIFTSAHAVQILDDFYLQPARFTIRNPVCCISGNTRKTVTTRFPDCPVIADAAYGKDLAAAIIRTGHIREVNFFCGNQRRDELPEMLQQAGIQVNEMVIYENVPTPAVTAEKYDGILFFSPSAVKSFFSANTLPPETVCFAIGSTTAAALKSHTDNNIIMSHDTMEVSMVQTAIYYFNNNNCYE
ncbi:uroporphyrinogen-III synthase [Chitinophaga solisilvae]|uniref:uroporphyrinogen-III synthase n=1 Tax=Chitinophaga solisilvae TaxID=1233460 RepID=UPI00136EA10D|nr:uroporphyrinogen-III synthase [Chitinophaga solisilvae]